MNKNIKTKWLEALRSGEYQQAQRNLKRGDSLCCLGVLCDIHAKETNNTWKPHSIGNRSDYSYIGKYGELPNEVIVWAGLNNSEPIVGDTTLIKLNDNLYYSFNQIADEIEKHL